MHLKLQIIKEFNEQTRDIIQTAYKLEAAYTTEADKVIDSVDVLLRDKDALNVEEIIYYITQIPIVIYALTDNMQQLCIKTDTAKMERKRVFNEAYLAQEHGTVAHKTSVAQSACEDEQFLEDLFTKVYKQCERKIDILEMLHGSLKKILNWRENEMQLTRTNMLSNGKGGF